MNKLVLIFLLGLDASTIMASVAFKRGVCYYKVAEYQMASADFNFVVELDNNNVANALNWLGKVALVNGEWKDAVALNTKAIAKDPEHLGAHHDRSFAYELLDNQELAGQDRVRLNQLKHKRLWKKLGGTISLDPYAAPSKNVSFSVASDAEIEEQMSSSHNTNDL